MGRRKRPGGAEAPQAAPAAAPPPPPPAPTGPSFKTLLACHGAVEAEEAASHGPVDKHPDSPSRLESAMARLKADKGLWHSLRKLPPRRATDAELQLCHDASHVSGLQKIAELAGEDSKPHFLPVHGPVCMGGPCAQVREGKKGADTFVTKGSLEAARFAVGGMLQMVDAALSPPEEGAPSHYSLRTGLALCRPPGHHASSNRSQGFCLLNSVAVAAAYARKKYPEVKKVLIFDWDVHHGQGTQEIFEQSRDVLVINVHRHDGRFYPGTGNCKEVGIGSGKGYTVNVPLPGGYGGAALWEACVSVLLPAARQFQPQLIIVSAGFDAVAGDPLGECTAEPCVFGALTTELLRLASEVAEGRLLMALEGGYNVDALSDCVEEVARALADEAAPEAELEPFAEQPAWLKGDACRAAIRRACEAHKSLPLRLPLPASKSEKRRKAGKPQDEPASNVEDREGPAVANGDAAEVAPVEVAAEEAAASPSAGAEAVGGAPAVAEAPPKAGAGPGRAVAAAETATATARPPPEPATPAEPRKAEAATGSRAKAKAATGSRTEAKVEAATGSRAKAKAEAATGSRAEAKAEAATGSRAEAKVEVSPGELLIRLTPVARPKEVMVSERELWLWHGAEAAGEAKGAPQKWRFEGVLADIGGALRSAEFRKRKLELTLRLRLGPILGGTVKLSPLP